MIKSAKMLLNTVTYVYYCAAKTELRSSTNCSSYIVVVPDGIQNSNVAIQRREKDVVG